MNRNTSIFRNIAGAAAIAVAAGSFTPAMPVAAAQGTSTQLGQAVEALRGISTLRADFIQTDRNGQSLSGKLLLKRPGHVRFEYQKDVPLLIVADGPRVDVLSMTSG